MHSYWELDQLYKNDFSIVGGGILGLFTALELSEKYPNSKIAVFERSQFSAGATSKNAGFACFGSASEIAKDRECWGNEVTLDIIQKRWYGIQKIQKLLGPQIDYENFGGYELVIDKDIDDYDLNELNEFLYPIFNKKIFNFDLPRLKEFGFGSSVKNLIYNSLEGQIHSGKLVKTLHDILRKKNVIIFLNSEITNFSPGAQVEFFVNNKWKVTTNKLIYCTNAFPPSADLFITPARGQVFITHPILDIKFKGCFHFHEGFYYFRNVGDRILFGGARHLDMEGETDNSFLLNELIQKDLIEKFSEIIIPGTRPNIDLQWSGIMAFSHDKLPVVKSIEKNVYYAMNCNGMGVSLSPSTALIIAEML